MEYLYSDITEKILKAAMNVHNALGNGFQEVIYQRALQVEFGLLNIRYRREVTMPVYYKNVYVGERRVDFLVEDKIVVELKAITQLENVHLAQAKNYLEAFQFTNKAAHQFWGNQLVIQTPLQQ